MTTKKILFVLSGFFVALCAVLFFVPGLVQADNYGLDKTAQSAGLPMNKDLATTLGNIVGSALSFISVLFFGLMLYGGIMWMTARGKSENTQKALDTIIAAIIGIVIVLAAYAITNFVFSNILSGSGGPTTPPKEEQNNCTTAHPSWSCQSISAGACGSSVKDAATCTDGNNCQTGLCPGSADNVCCLGGGAPGTPGVFYCPKDGNVIACEESSASAKGGVNCFLSSPACIAAVQQSIGKDVGVDCLSDLDCKSDNCDLGTSKCVASGSSGTPGTPGDGSLNAGEVCTNADLCASGLTCTQSEVSSPIKKCYSPNSVGSSGYCNPTFAYCKIELKCMPAFFCAAREVGDDCTGNAQCGSLLRCNTDTKKCVTGQNGTPCANDSGCFTDLVCNQSSDECQSKLPSSPDSSCERDIECSSGVCWDTDYCIEKVTASGNCHRSIECHSTFCVNGTCT